MQDNIMGIDKAPKPPKKEGDAINEASAEKKEGEKKTPEEWAVIRGIFIRDPDGWRGEKSYDEPITLEEFNERVNESTIQSRESFFNPKKRE